MNKPLNRRAFMRAAAAAPLAIQSAAQQQAVALVDAGVMPALGGVMGANEALRGGSTYAARKLNLAALAKSNLLPEWFLAKTRVEARRHARYLDPDVAALRSVSLSAKIGMQEERVIRREIDGLEHHTLYEQEWENFFYGSNG